MTDEISIEERITELEWLMTATDLPDHGFATVGDVHLRVIELMGRDVWTHELAQPDLLVHELRTGIVPSMDGVIAKLPPDLPVVVIEVPDEQ